MKIEQISIDSIKPYAKNPRKNDKAVATVAKSIEQYGFQQPIVVDRDGVIIVGHTRYRAAKQLKLTTVPVLRAQELTQEQAQAYRIMDNRSNENALWDTDLLLEELTDLLTDTTIHGLSEQSGFTESELNRMFKNAEDELLDIETNSEIITYSKPGDLWLLGDHKILNGDSTDPKAYKELLENEQIDLVWEDAPYGIDYVSPASINRTEAENRAKTHKIANDNLAGEELDMFLYSHIKQVYDIMKPGAAIYWCHDMKFHNQFKQVLEKVNIHISDTLIWKKNTHSTWLVDYAKYYEPILYGWKSGAEHGWYGVIAREHNAFTLNDLEDMSKEQLIEIIQATPTNYQEFSKETRKISNLHPTVKPVKLIVYHIINSTVPKQIVFDGFSGSGSTLIACEKTGRYARCIELEPKFVDVTIKRWQDETGLEAIRAADGVTWNSLKDAGIFTEQVNENLETLFGMGEDNATE